MPDTTAPAVHLRDVRLQRGGRTILSGIDLLDGTPVLDIKPYVPYADAVADARNDMADAPPPLIAVDWQNDALRLAHQHAQRLNEPLVELIEQCLARHQGKWADAARELGVDRANLSRLARRLGIR